MPAPAFDVYGLSLMSEVIGEAVLLARLLDIFTLFFNKY